MAEKLIPTDHGFGMQRLPLETEYFEAYNRDNIHLVDITQTPIECITETGLQTAAKHFELDVIIYATGFPNMIMVAGSQSVSGSTNYPRAIETGVEWVTRLIKHAVDNGNTRIEAQVEAERDWQKEVIQAQERMPFRQSKSWFTGYNSNVDGHETGQFRYQAYWGGAPRYRSFLAQIEKNVYSNIDLD